MTAPAERVIDFAGHRIPSLSYRILAGAALLVGLFVALVALPDSVLAYLQGHGVALPLPIETATVAGAILSALATARYILRPSRLYGPLSIATSLATIGYLLQFWWAASYRFTIPGSSSATFQVGYVDLILLLLVVPALGLLAGVVTTIEDLSAPGERLPFDYPA